MDDTSLRKNKGYWVYMNESGNLTLPSAGGTWSNESFNWNKLRFVNGSDELNITDAGDEGWLAQTALQYWDNGWKEISGSPPPTGKSIISSWEGIFIKSNVDNLTLIRQN